MKKQDPYIHDCEKCEWVGWLTGFPAGKNDLGNVYVHRGLDGYITVLIRYGDEGHEYVSMSTGNRKGPIGFHWLSRNLS